MAKKDFATFAKDHNLEEDEFPHSQSGPKSVRRLQSLLLSITIMLILFAGGSFWASKIRIEPLTSTQIQILADRKKNSQAITAKINKFISSVAHGGNNNNAGGTSNTQQNSDAATAQAQEDELEKQQNEQIEQQQQALDGQNGSSSQQGSTTQDNGQQSGTGTDSSQQSQAQQQESAQQQQMDAYNNQQINKHSRSTMMKNYLSFALAILKYIIYMTIVVFVLLGIVYLINVVKRQRSFERNVISNDMHAASLRTQLMNALSVTQKLGDAKASVKSRNKSRVSSSDRAKVEQWRAMKKMNVSINTRQSLDSNMIEQKYIIKIDIPSDDDVSKNVLTTVNRISNLASKLVKGKVAFGAPIISQDRQSIRFSAVNEYLDRYDYSGEVEKVTNSTSHVTYESSYPLSIFTDRSASIKEKKSKALDWSKRTGKTLDSYLKTMKIEGSVKKIDVGSTNALYIYSLAEDTKLPAFEKLGDQLDKSFNTTGATASLSGGDLSITLPLPKDFILELDVPTMYREVFL